MPLCVNCIRFSRVRSPTRHIINLSNFFMLHFPIFSVIFLVQEATTLIWAKESLAFGSVMLEFFSSIVSTIVSLTFCFFLRAETAFSDITLHWQITHDPLQVQILLLTRAQQQWMQILVQFWAASPNNSARIRLLVDRSSLIDVFHELGPSLFFGVEHKTYPTDILQWLLYHIRCSFTGQKHYKIKWLFDIGTFWTSTLSCGWDVPCRGPRFRPTIQVFMYPEMELELVWVLEQTQFQYSQFILHKGVSHCTHETYTTVW